MGHQPVASILAVAVATICLSAATFAQAPKPARPPRTTAALRTPDLAGVWVKARGYGRRFNPKEEPPMQAWAAERYRAAREGITDPDQQGRDELDPAIMSCAPVGMPRIMIYPRAFEIIQIPGRVMMLFEWDHFVRQIYLDAKPPDDPDPIWLGYSNGRWDKDTLVVDTVGLTEKTWLDSVGHPHSDALHVVERIQRVSADRLQIDFTFDDPKAYTRPWTGQVAYQRMADWQILEHFACENSELYGDALLKGKDSRK